MRVNSKYFNPCSVVKFEPSDYWSSSAQLKRMYDLKLRACCQFKFAHDELGHNCYFLTLTFRDEYLYHFRWRDYDLLGFDQDLVNKFFKRLRDKLLKDYNITGITYLCAEELGHTTNRPHLHVCISVPSSLSSSEVYDIISSLWTFGFIYPKRYDGGPDSHGFYHRPILIDDSNLIACVSYCTKYMLKDVCNPNNIYDDVLKLLEKSDDYEKLRELKRCMPKIKTSLRFGSAIEHYLYESSDRVQDIFDSVLNGLDLPWYNADASVSLPQYTKNRLMFDNVLDRIEEVDLPDGKTKKIYRYCRYRSQFYKDYVHDNFENIVQSTAKDLQSLCYSFILDSDFEKYCEDSNIPLSKSQFYGVNFSHLAMYHLVYRNRLSPSHLFHFLNNPDNYVTKHFNSVVDSVDSVPVRNCFGVCRVETRTTRVQIEYDFMPTFQVVPQLDSNPFLRDDEFCLMPKGDESIDEMYSNARDFLCQQNRLFDYASQCFVNDFPINEFVLFNSYPCFSGFDEILTLLNEYRIYKRGKKDAVVADIKQDINYLIKKDIETFYESEQKL